MTIELTEAQRSELRQAIGRLDGTTDLTPALTELYLRLKPGPEPPEKQYRDYAQHKAEQAERMKEPCECRKTEQPNAAGTDLPRKATKLETWNETLRGARIKQRGHENGSSGWWYYEGMKVVASIEAARNED